jgi:prophage regulatory protein
MPSCSGRIEPEPFWGQAMSSKQNETLSILRRWQVEAKTGLSRSTIYRRMRDGTFPPAIPLGGRMVGWRVGDIEQFLSNPGRYRAPAPEDRDNAEPRS